MISLEPLIYNSDILTELVTHYSYGERVSLSLVSKKLYTLVNAIRRSVLNHLKVIDAKEIGRFDTKREWNFLNCTRFLNLSALKLDDQISIIAKAPNLRFLSICNQNLKNEGLTTLQKLPHLEKLDLEGCTQITGEEVKNIQFVPNLVELNISMLPLIKVTQVKEIFKYCTQLNSLRMEGCIEVKGAVAIPDASRFKVLSFKGCTGITEFQLSEDASVLRELNLSHCRIPKLDFLLRATRLTQLFLLKCDQIPWFEFQKISFCAKSLKSLDVGNCNINNLSIVPIALCTELKNLSVAWCQLLNDICLIATPLRKLQRLNLRGCPITKPEQLTDFSDLTVLEAPIGVKDHLEKIVSLCRKLKELTIGDVDMKLKHIKWFSKLTELQKVYFFYSGKRPPAKILQSLTNLASLRSLTSNLPVLDVFTTLTQLKDYRYYDQSTGKFGDFTTSSLSSLKKS